MAISNVSSQSRAVYTPPSPPESTEPKVKGRDARNDGDSDDGGTKAVNSASSAPVVNTAGNLTGSLLNTKA